MYLSNIQKDIILISVATALLFIFASALVMAAISSERSLSKTDKIEKNRKNKIIKRIHQLIDEFNVSKLDLIHCFGDTLLELDEESITKILQLLTKELKSIQEDVSKGFILEDNGLICFDSVTIENSKKNFASILGPSDVKTNIHTEQMAHFFVSDFMKNLVCCFPDSYLNKHNLTRIGLLTRLCRGIALLAKHKELVSDLENRVNKSLLDEIAVNSDPVSQLSDPSSDNLGEAALKL